METRATDSTVAYHPSASPSSTSAAEPRAAGGSSDAGAAVPTNQEVIKELAESRDFLEAVLDTAVDAIITFDRFGVIQSINPSATRMFGYDAPELIGQNISLLIPSPFRRSHDSYVSRYLHNAKSQVRGIRRETIALRKDNSVFSIDLVVSEIDHRGLFTAIVRDLSERKVLERQVLDIANEEQRRIGQELHDCTGQELTGLSLIAGSVLEAISRECESGKAVSRQQLESWRASITKLTTGLALANQHVQQLSRGIIPMQIDRDGMCKALRELCARTDELPGVSCRIICPEEVKADSHHCATQVYRIAQEAINNALRHGRATEIVVTVSRRPDEGFLEIRDNGKGFVVEEAFSTGLPQDSYASHKKGHGLRIMRYRASMIGGTLDVRSEPGKGTTVRCSFTFHHA